MKEITFVVKLMNRVKPIGLDGYVRGQKLPLHLRLMSSDHLNVFRKTVRVSEYDHGSSVWSKEIISLQEKTPWKIEQTPDFGDTLIGYVVIEEFRDFYREIYKTKQS
jgi:hypothetical protein